jgi:N utilization substance protein B
MAKPSTPNRARHHARRFVMQALYQWQLGKHSLRQLLEQFLAEPDMAGADDAYFETLLSECYAGAQELEAHYSDYLDRPLHQLDPVERAILLVAATELALHPEIPYRVVINEAVELAKAYAAEGSHSYINGVVDKAAQTLRPLEFGRRL